MKVIRCLRDAGRFWSGAVLIGLVSGCASPNISDRSNPVPPPARSSAETVAAADVSRSADSFEPAQAGDRQIEPGDILVIEVFGEQDLTVERRVQVTGTILYPLLGLISVAGSTTAEVAQTIADRLYEGQFLKDPQVSVDVKEYRLQTVSVMGFVEKPGAVKLPSEKRMDIIEAIAEAGGFSRIANKGKIDLTRGGKTTTYSFEELRRVTDPRRKVWLQPGDVIYVHESFI